MHDFIAIGDITTDAFIKLKDASVHCDVNDEKCQICMAFGDKIPYESVEEISAVGNSPNASVAAARLGLKSALVTNLGDDSYGHRCLETLTSESVDTQFVSIHAGKKSNYHYVLWYEHDRTILVKHQEYERILPDIGKPKWLYLSSLGEDTIAYHGAIADYVRNNLEVNLAFQPGTFQISLSTEGLGEIYKKTKIFFCNTEEAERILGIDTLGPQELLKRMRDLGPEIVVITAGPKGAYAYDGSKMYFQPAYPDQKPAYDRTGAGDAFASTTVAALALGNDLPTALKWASVNAMSVCQELGAQRGLLSREKIEEYLKSASPEFETKVL
ncbi:MAG: hypothetical protein A3J09_00950 [Candidatus Zambryskibacteria bacterium RIFCSPLOWO2_02_FULL_51_21]|uniref:Carbohydrate kinase PfkB domain-containing protein n=1 Tax=Candidatus Zambryskibacteria bacterium RIFCSPHIGHO2_02_FULL_43_37 TaxID=1802749 RepID=A0A1G2THJ3_9BACT|nr:MAG: hypothetical protein A2723_00950 [Candidatus Zambryskibacteria bacterium RIFCSPHIGHO2_01_FULL_52_18]OHA96766.1 MAG: hypothetical protein A3D49_02910 [Candidatus Zambryskibacteria bacterium RIFCSPHIGHO2_02_FULL_43_37]OHB07459.1 MAG: hypothetical protein A2944_01980 [Candidatus Zambryskibacteria bacterium RIFCSPLOWO2_01_FULL_52_12]OHB11122.1 MAG: hypothetical protein A3J09_00950 [Candidatus Zambryskibacteria bacterium RIFCSPLOWO2_02_FULL_51_21]